MEILKIREIPKVINYLQKNYLNNGTFSKRFEVEKVMSLLKEDYCDWIYEERRENNEYNLNVWFDEAYAPMNCNNWANLDKLEEFTEKRFLDELDWVLSYENVLKAVELETF